MRSLLRWILSVIGYGAYTVAVLALLLWYLFPAESVRTWLEAELERQSESLGWEIGSLRLALPFSAVASDVKILDRGRRETLLLVDELRVMPDASAASRLAQEWPLSYQARMLGGTVRGDMILPRKSKTVTCTGEITMVQVGGLEGLWLQLGRKGSGTLAGSFTYEGQWPVSLSGKMRADLSLANGSLELKQPVFGQNTLAFNQAKASLSLTDRVVTLDNGKVDSNLFGADFNGTVALADTLLGSGLNIQGSFEPRPELLGNLEGAVVELIKGQLQDSRLTFSITDTLLEPGLLFQGISGVIDGLIQGGER